MKVVVPASGELQAFQLSRGMEGRGKEATVAQRSARTLSQGIVLGTRPFGGSSAERCDPRISHLLSFRAKRPAADRPRTLIVPRGVLWVPAGGVAKTKSS